MGQPWTPEQLRQIDSSRELEIASRRPDDTDRDLRSAVDAAYTAEYAPSGGSVGQMTTDTAAATTLRLSPLAH